MAIKIEGGGITAIVGGHDVEKVHEAIIKLSSMLMKYGCAFNVTMQYQDKNGKIIELKVDK